jgi:SAM-dependent methyltransferase
MTPRSIAMTTVGAIALGVGGYFAYTEVVARRVLQETDRLARVLALAPTSRVADVGAGNGAYAFALASRTVAQGQVFATEIEDDAVAALRQGGSSAGLRNITALRASEESTNLPHNCCDAVFLRGVYHHITRPAETASSLHDALRSGGRLAIIDFEPSWLLSTFFPVSDVPSNRGGHGVPPVVVISELEQAGFKLIDRVDDWPSGQYCLVFLKP